MKRTFVLWFAVACAEPEPSAVVQDAAVEAADADASGEVDSSQAADSAGELPIDSQAAQGPEIVPAGTTPATCLAATANEGQCKDCCDCLDLPCEQIVACRDACPKHDFTSNSITLQVSAPTVLGMNGDYSVCTQRSPEQACKTCCECENRFVCGDKRHCRDACMGVKTP